ncbi:MAG: CPBP family intramembrane glutamic endopeptidase [Melioribacteraceae bacterium]
MYTPIIYLLICILISCFSFIFVLGSYGQVLVLIMGLVVFPLQKFVHKDTLQNLGFRKCKFKNILKGFLLPIIILGLITLINILIGLVKIQSLGEIRNPFNGGAPISTLIDFSLFLFINFAILFILEFITEELLFRGYLLNKLTLIYGEMKGIFISSIVFGLWHLPISIWLIGFDSGRTFIYIFNMFLLGIVLALLFQESKSLIPVVIFHALWNTLEYNFFGFANQTGLLMGTNRIIFDPEEGLIGTFTLLLFIGFLYKKTLIKKVITQPI